MGMLEVDAADRIALATALGPLGAAVAVAEQDALTRAVEWLRSNKGAASLLVARDGAGSDHDEPDAATAERLRSAGARAVREVVRAGATSPAARRVAETLGQVLATTFVVVDWATAVTLHRESPRLTFVTRDGDVAGPLGYRIGTVGNAGPALARAAAEEAEAAVATLEAELAAFAEQEAQLASEIVTRTAQRDEAQEALLESDARLTGAAERLERIDEERRILVEQRAALTTQSEEVGAVLTDDRSTLATLEAEESADRSEEDGSARDAHATDLDMRAAALDAALVAAREASFEARIALQRAEDARDRTTAEAARLRGEAEAIDLAHARAVARREDRRAGVVRCDALDRVTTLARSVLERALVEADEARATRLAERDRFRTLLDEARESVGDTARALEQHREIRHRTELRRAEVHSRLAALEARIRTELALGLDDVRSDQPDAAELDDARLVEREDVLVRRLGLLGRVNPLALEEFQALEERHRFLSDQLNDLRRSRQDLEEVIGAVDERIRVVFKEAFDDIAREFQLTFETMFPGGKGRLVLTGAEDLLTAGVEVEARPPGKKVQRLSLLSGGERSLTVLAFVFAIFRARPSPFYVLDEVDAALDDVNLQRLLKVIRSFRGNAQVIMVTHQKRSMEIADLLYGITMGPDAVTKVVSERLRDRRAVAALDERASDAPTAALDEQAAATAPAGTA
jgi:chromosome segregation protein